MNHPYFKAAEKLLEAEWKAFQRTHKMIPKPVSPQKHSRFWTHEDHVRDSQRLNLLDQNKP